MQHEPDSEFAKLRQMIGKAYNINGETRRISDVAEITSNFIVFYSDGGSKPVMKDDKSVADFMGTHKLVAVAEPVQKTVTTPKIILPIKDTEVPMPPQNSGNQRAVVELVSLNTSDMKMLTTGLREKFLQLQNGADKKTIDEANAMVGITGQFISLAKVEMMALKHSQQRK